MGLKMLKDFFSMYIVVMFFFVVVAFFEFRESFTGILGLSENGIELANPIMLPSLSCHTTAILSLMSLILKGNGNQLRYPHHSHLRIGNIETESQWLWDWSPGNLDILEV